jgi:hypothetical protein
VAILPRNDPEAVMLDFVQPGVTGRRLGTARAAVVKLGRLELTGFLGGLFWSVVHIYFLITARDRFIVAFTGFGTTSPSSAAHEGSPR